jgi:glycosyltransferase involved in cell wall biosynthesis
MKVALVYDRVNKWGGAERILLALHELFPDAPLYTSVYDPIKAPWAKVFLKVIPSFLQKFKWFRDKHELLGAFMPMAFERFNFDRFDTVISVTSEAAKGIITKPGTLHICYCLTPTRYLWSGYELYFSNPFLKWMSKPIVSYLQTWDRVAANRPDIMISISSEVKNRIQKYYHRDSRIIFPGVEERKLIKHLSGKYYLVVSRLVKYKKIDLVIKAFNYLGFPLIIVGVGSEEKHLKHIARGNITFMGEINEEKLVGFYKSAKALIFPQEEDFGLTAIEAQAVGLPVIAFKKGGALDIVTEGKTGVFFNEQLPDCLVKTVKKFDKMHFREQDLIDNAKRFSKTVFQKEFMSIMGK